MPLHIRSRLSLFGALCCLSVLLIDTHPARAALGGDETSIETDRGRMKAELRSKTSAAGYTVHEMQTPSGTTVREYVAADGKVFAVSWRGPTKPDLRSMLGPYFDVYSAAARAHGAGGHHHVQVDRAELVMHSEGHMRALYGRAFVPQLVPRGLAVEDLE